MKERPILCSSPMVQAILDGWKSQTRRIVRMPEGYRLDGYATVAYCFRMIDGDRVQVTCPYGEDGDRLWVRETFSPSYFGPGKHGYRADWTSPDGVPEPRWKPSIFMRRSESRITLEVTSVRVERLQAISERDATAEGCATRTYRDGRGVEPASGEYRKLWDSINGKRAPWASNPWVWVVSFRRVDHAYVAQMTIQEGADVEGGP